MSSDTRMVIYRIYSAGIFKNSGFVVKWGRVEALQTCSRLSIFQCTQQHSLQAKKECTYKQRHETFLKTSTCFLPTCLNLKKIKGWLWGEFSEWGWEPAQSLPVMEEWPVVVRPVLLSNRRSRFVTRKSLEITKIWARGPTGSEIKNDSAGEG